MGKLLKFTRFLFSVLLQPALLILVWLFHVHPLELFASVFNIKITQSISPMTEGAIDVAILTALFNIIFSLIPKKFNRPIKIIFKIQDPSIRGSESEISVGEDSSGILNITGDISVESLVWVKIFNLIGGITASFHWHSEWLSVRVDNHLGAKPSKLFHETEGAFKFNFLALMGEQETSSSFSYKMHILCNSGVRDKGDITAKVITTSHQNHIVQALNCIALRLFVESNVGLWTLKLRKAEP